MKKLIVMFLLLLIFSNSNAQSIDYFDALNDVVTENGQGQMQKISGTAAYVSKINLSGNYTMMVIVIGFPDIANTQSWPQIGTANVNYPYRGAFPTGTTLNDYIDQNGPVNVEDWHGEGFEQFFDTQSNGQYTVDVVWPKTATNDRYLTDSLLSYWGTGNNVIWNNWDEMGNQVAKKMVAENPNVFNDVDMIQLSFDGVLKNIFHTEHSGRTWSWDQSLRDPDNSGNIYFTGPMAINWRVSSLVHEFCHKMGAVAGSPSGFNGLPDRGENDATNDEVADGHYNLTTTYDVMYHNDNFPALHSLYGLIPLTSYDLIFFNWIKDDEIKVIHEGESLSGIYLAPINEVQLDQDTYKIIKVMIHENYSGELDEYFLIEYHKGTNFDKQYHNFDEGTFNEGVLIWHIKEIRDMINISTDNMIDIELAVPYNGWNNNPIPDDGYVGNNNYDRSAEDNWNNNNAGDFDWLDDIQITNGTFNYMPDGGRNIWSTTVPNDTNNGFTWDASGERWLYRINSLKSDFFTDQPVNGIVTNSMTNSTRPSTKDWAGDPSNIEIKNIRQVNQFMVVDVFTTPPIESFPFTATGTTEGQSNDYEINGSNCGDVAYSMVLTETKVLNLTLCASGTDYDTQMGIFNADGSSTGYENDDNEDCSFNRQFSYLENISLDAGNYYVVVDGYSTYEGNYELSVEEVGGSGGQTPDFTIPNLPYTHTYNNVGVSNDWDLQIPGGADIAYKLVLSSASTINITLCSSNTDFDTMLEIFNADGTSTGQFNDDNEDCSFNRQFSALEDISLAAGTYFIVVDGYNGYEGNYEIQVNYSTTGNEILSLPFTDIGSIVGENDNWNVEGGDGSDFSYNLVLESATTIDITLCSSDTDYDSKLEIFNEDGTTTGFYNDDYEDCSFNRQYSYLETISLDAGNYYVVVDGYDGATGNYGLSITEVQQKNAPIVLNKNSINTYKLFVEPQRILAAFEYEAQKKNSKITFRNRNVFTDKSINQKVIDNADGYIVNLEKELNGDKPLPKKYFNVSPPVDKRIIEEYDREKRKKQEDGKRNELILNPAYPDPANPSTTISYYLPERTNVSIKIYNSLGRLVKTLVRETQQSGEHSLLWNGKNNNGNQVSSGIYFIKFSALDKNLSQKIILLK